MFSHRIPKAWDGEADVIIVGAGNAGLPAAITAAERGARVILLETWSAPASSLAYISGGTLFACTDIQKENNVKDSKEELLKEALRVTGGSEEMWGALVDEQLGTYEWLKSLGARTKLLMSVPGQDRPRVHHFEGHGTALLKMLRQKAEENKNIEVLYKHHAERLICDPESGRVIGIIAKHEKKDLNFRAKKAVIIATGGFISNKELLKEYGPNFADLVPTAPPTHMGDGLKMAMGVGAATAGIGLAVCPSMPACIDTKHITSMPMEGAITVTKEAQRWADEMATETGSYNYMYEEIVRREPDGRHFIIYDSKIRREALPKHYKSVKEYCADSIEELAKTVGLDPKALKATVDKYNSNIDKYGYDKEFGRRCWGGPMGKAQVPKIDEPPFYAIKAKVCLTSLKGGIKINGKAQTIDQFGAVIPGLYAAGEVTGGLIGKFGGYYTGLMTLNAFAFGRIAGKNATAEAGA